LTFKNSFKIKGLREFAARAFFRAPVKDYSILFLKSSASFSASAFLINTVPYATVAAPAKKEITEHKTQVKNINIINTLNNKK
tara:strand:+ start:335 stop:583 length:249 start_codon:yes stop_codon:yes gene_type:complete